MFVFGKVLTDLAFARAGFAELLLPGIIALTVAVTGLQGTALPLVIDFSFTKEIEDRLLAPLPVGFVALEKILFGTLRALIAGAIMFPIGRLVLGTLPFQASRTWLLIAFLLLGAVMGSGLGMTLGTLVQPSQISIVFALVLTPLLFTGVHPIPVAVTVEPPVVPGAHAREPADLRERGRARLDGAPGAAHARLDRGHRADLCHGRAGRGWRHGVHAPCDRLDRLGAGLVDKRNRTCGRYGLLLESKNAVIYGGGGAIGAAVARAFAREGAKVHLAGRTLERLEAVAGTIRSAGGVASTARVDALDERAVDEHADAVAADAGGIDISFNLISHGDVQGTPLAEMRLEDFERPVVTAVRTMFLTSRAAARHMIRQGSGVILAFGGDGDPPPCYHLGGLQVAFSAMEALRRNLASELGPHGIRVLTLRTGGVPETLPEGFDGRQAIVNDIEGNTMLKRAATLDDVGNVAAFAASDHARTMTATALNISCGAIVD